MGQISRVYFLNNSIANNLLTSISYSIQYAVLLTAYVHTYVGNQYVCVLSTIFVVFMFSLLCRQLTIYIHVTIMLFDLLYTKKITIISTLVICITVMVGCW